MEGSGVLLIKPIDQFALLRDDRNGSCVRMFSADTPDPVATSTLSNSTVPGADVSVAETPAFISIHIAVSAIDGVSDHWLVHVPGAPPIEGAGSNTTPPLPEA